ncbi:serine kinase [Paraburkholderia sp. Ac-20340]|uniref:serine kinase n=1 Tax=Paraburkholderia sp. Ac-20340 TaxID=2703888 RepID=UPI00197E3AC9|nr:serine kinase [Paraburkholderia sp. Ac-20340]MBN3857574.1 serine kinase [Paraburkholderia sp. Ac-20340]
MNSTLVTQFDIDRILDTGSGTHASTPPAALAERFQALLEQEPGAQASLSATSAPGSRLDVVKQAVEDQAADYRQVPNDVLYMSQHLSALSMERLAAADMTIQLEIASLNADLQVKMATVQSTKDAVQTLMKNQ